MLISWRLTDIFAYSMKKALTIRAIQIVNGKIAIITMRRRKKAKVPPNIAAAISPITAAITSVIMMAQ